MRKVLQFSILFFFLSIFTLQAQTIKTYVWEDMNANGIQDGGEVGIGGMINGEVALYTDPDTDGIADVLVSNAPTDIAGEYTFTGVADGDYVIVYTGFAGYYLTQGGLDTDATDPTDDSDVEVMLNTVTPVPTMGTSHTFHYTAGPDKVNVDAGFFQPASVGDYVWEDMDGDGEQEFSDQALANINIDISDNLLNPIYDIAGNLLNTIQSTAAGAYVFIDLIPGDYILRFSDPGGAFPAGTYYPTKKDIVADDIDSDIDRSTGETDVFSLVSAQIEIDIDAGFFNPIEISDLVWHDLNADGIQDGGMEIGIDNIDVDIYDATTFALALDIYGNTNTISTSGGGMYIFDEMPPGEYYLTFTDPAGNYYFTYMDEVTATEATDSDCGDLTTGTLGQTDQVIYVSGDVTDEIDAGLFLPAKIGNYIWEDMNGNGLQDPGEPDMMDGINITLTDEFDVAVDDVDGNPIGGMTSDVTGFYQFVQLRPRNYILTFDEDVPNWYRTKVDEPGAAGTDPTDPTDPEDDSDADPLDGKTGVIEITSDEDNEYIDAGFYKAAKIGNYVWEDMNGDGQDDGSEPPLDGVTISIIDVSTGVAPFHVDHTTPVADEISAGGGLYEFIDLPPGEYILVFNEPAPYHYGLLDYNGGNMDFNDDADDSDPDKNNATPGSTHNILLESDEEQMDIDAAYYQVTKVGDFVFHDREWNGIYDGTDVGVENFTVRLFKSDGTPALDFADIDISTTTTDLAGNYEFTDLPPGIYYVEGVLSGDWLFTKQDFPAGANDDLTDIENDSDAQDATGANPGRTHEFLLESNELTETRVDLGIYKQIKVGGTIWNDQDQNGLFDIATEGTYADVRIDLIDVTTGLVVVSTVSITPVGTYLFEDIDPGEYKILILDINFTTGQPLFSTESTPGQQDANVDVDDDDNGDDIVADGCESTPFFLTCGEEPEMDGIVNTYIDFGFYVEFDCNASTLSQASCELVESTITFSQGGDLLCDLNVLDVYCATMPTNLVSPYPTPLCPGGGGAHNMSWFAFVAGNGNYDIEVVPSNCVSAPGQSDLGVQTGIYTDCTFSDAIICNPLCSTDPVTLNSNLLTPGETYYFFLDGCSGSVCDYEVNILGDFQVFQIPEPDGIRCQTVDCDVPLCPGQEVVIEVFDLDLDVTYFWDIPAGVDILNPLDPSEPHITDENNINLKFTDVGTYHICMVGATNYCASTNIPVCMDIVVEELQDEVFLDESVCANEIGTYIPTTMDDPNGDGTLGWQVTGPFSFVDGVPYTGTVMTAAGCEYDQTITINAIPLPAPEDVDTAGCMAFSIPAPLGTTFDVNTNVVNVPIVYPGGSVAGCDTTINWTAYLLNIDGYIQNLGCIGQNVVSLIYNVSNISPSPNNPDLTIDYVWKNALGDVIVDTDGNPKTVDVTMNGTVSLTITMSIFGVECSYPYSLDIDFNDYLPSNSVIDGDLNLCDNVLSSSYKATNTDDDVYLWNWTVPPPAFIEYGDLSDSIVINWNGALGGEICVSAVNACGEQLDPNCITVVLTASPIADLSIDSEVCVDKVATATFNGNSTAGTSFSWDFGGGVIQSATTSTEEGPHEVNWSTAGMKMIILNVTENGCPAIPDTGFIEVIAPPTLPILMCSSDDNSITFTWTDTFSTSVIYTIDLISGTAGVLDAAAKSYTISGLTDGQVVRIRVEADNGGLCGSVFSLPAECEVQNCVPPMVSIVIPNDSICVDASTTTMTLTADIAGGVAGVGTFSSIPKPGAITTDGVFDPIVAGPGEHTISFQFVTDVDDCVANAGAKTIVVAETPTSSFDLDSTNICVTGSVEFTYTGNNSAAVYEWDFGDDVATSGGGVGPFEVVWDAPGTKTITLTVTNLFCESETTTHTVEVDPLLEAPDINCGANGSSTAIEFVWDAVIGADSYDISIDGVSVGNQTNLDYLTTGLTAGDSLSIEVIALSANLCPSTSSSLKCFATECPIASISGLTDLCITDSLVLDFVGVTHDDIHWDTGDALVDGVSTADRKILRWDTPGTYDVFLKTNKSDCQEIVDQITVTVGPALDAIVITCEPTLNSINYSWNSQACVTNYEIFVNGVSEGIITDTEYLVGSLAEGDDVDIRVVGKSDCICGDVEASLECSATACPTIGLTINLPISEFCIGSADADKLMLTATVTGDDTGSGVPGWGSDDLTISSSGEIDLSILTEGTYDFTFFYKVDNCDFSATEQIIMHARPVLFYDPMDPDCYLDNTGAVIFSATSIDPVTITLDNVEVTPPMVGKLNPGNHNMEAETDFGCLDEATFVIVEAIKPDLSIEGSALLPIGGTEDLSYLIIGDIGGVADSVVWTSSEGILCDQGLCDKITISPIIDDKYCVKIWYNEGCEIEECFDVRLEQIEITIVNTFSPDSEDDNQVFNVSFFNTGQEMKSMRIYDRWGSELFATKEIVQNEANWNGKFKGSPLLPGVYVYVIETVLENGRTKVYTGDITIVK